MSLINKLEVCISNERLALKILVGTLPFLQLSITTSLVPRLTRLWEKSQFLSPEPSLFCSSDQSCPHLFCFLWCCDSQQKPTLAPDFISICRATALLAGHPAILRWRAASLFDHTARQFAQSLQVFFYISFCINVADCKILDSHLWNH